MKKLKFEFSVTGLLIGLILTGMFAFIFANMATELTTEYNLAAENNTLSQYNNFDSIKTHTQDIEVSVTAKGDADNVADIIGGFFSGGWAALKTAFESFDLYKDMMDQASADIPALAFISNYLTLIILVGLFIGVGITVLVKMRV